MKLHNTSQVSEYSKLVFIQELETIRSSILSVKFSSDSQIFLQGTIAEELNSGKEKSLKSFS